MNSSGAPVSGALVNAWVPSSSGAPTATRRTIYTDAQTSTPASNPATAGSSGHTVLYRLPGQGVTITITDAAGAVTYHTVHYPADEDSATSNSIVIATYAALTALTVANGLVDQGVYYVLGRERPGDGGEGTFVAREASNRTADGGVWLTHDSLDYKFQRIDFTRPSVKFWPGNFDGVGDDKAAFQAAFDYLTGWNLTATATKTANYSPSDGELVPCNTTSGAFTITLPASPSVGERIGVYDSHNTFDSNNLTIDRNGNNIAGAAANVTLSDEGERYVLEYGENGWFRVWNTGTLHVPAGSYRLASGVTITATYPNEPGQMERHRVEMEGDGDGNTFIKVDFAGTGFTYSGATLTGSFGITGLTLLGTLAASNKALAIDNCAHFEFNFAHILEFDVGIEATDVLASVWTDALIQTCNDGATIAYADSSRPNAVLWNGVRFVNARKRGFTVTGAATLVMNCGSIESCGQNAGTPFSGGYGGKLIDCGVEGAEGAVFNGVYCEGNATVADIWFTQASGFVKHRVDGSFCRIASTHYVDNNIRNDVAGGTCEVEVSGGFNALGSYTESTARKYIAANAGTIIDTGCAFGSETAEPSQLIYKSSPLFTDTYHRYFKRDDFRGDQLEDEYTTAVGTDAQCSVATAGGVINGRLVLSTGDDGAVDHATNGVQIAFGARTFRASAGKMRMTVRLTLEDITSCAWFFGFTDTTALEMPFTLGGGDALTSNATDAAGVLFDVSADTDRWWAVGVANDVDATKVDIGVAPVANTYETFEIRLSTAGAMEVLRNGVTVASVSAAVTASVLLVPVITGFSRAAAAKVLTADVIDFGINRV